MKTQLLAFSLLATLFIGCPPTPVVPDAGTTGGSQGIGGSPELGGSAGTGGATPSCTTTCCTTCAILATHGCPESRPTARGAPCDLVCDNAESVLPWPKLSGSPSLPTIRKSYTCKGGK